MVSFWFWFWFFPFFFLNPFFPKPNSCDLLPLLSNKINQSSLVWIPGTHGGSSNQPDPIALQNVVYFRHDPIALWLRIYFGFDNVLWDVTAKYFDLCLELVDFDLVWNVGFSLVLTLILNWILKMLIIYVVERFLIQYLLVCFLYINMTS